MSWFFISDINKKVYSVANSERGVRTPFRRKFRLFKMPFRKRALYFVLFKTWTPFRKSYIHSRFFGDFHSNDWKWTNIFEKIRISSIWSKTSFLVVQRIKLSLSTKKSSYNWIFQKLFDNFLSHILTCLFWVEIFLPQKLTLTFEKKKISQWF